MCSPGAEVLLSRGPLVDAVLASAAIPGVLPAVEWEGRLLIDGGVVDNTPISHAIGLGAREVYVLPTGGPCELTAAPRGALAMLMHATGLMVSQRFAAEAASVPERIDVVVLPPPCPIDVQPMDFGHARRLMDRAEDDAVPSSTTAPERSCHSVVRGDSSGPLPTLGAELHPPADEQPETSPAPRARDVIAWRRGLLRMPVASGTSPSNSPPTERSTSTTCSVSSIAAARRSSRRASSRRSCRAVDVHARALPRPPLVPVPQ